MQPPELNAQIIARGNSEFWRVRGTVYLTASGSYLILISKLV
jgi:hypothetical protein